MHPARSVKRAVTRKVVKKARPLAHPLDNAGYTLSRSLNTKRSQDASRLPSTTAPARSTIAQRRPRPNVEIGSAPLPSPRSRLAPSYGEGMNAVERPDLVPHTVRDRCDLAAGSELALSIARPYRLRGLRRILVRVIESLLD